jgi:hypothetical protein
MKKTIMQASKETIAKHIAILKGLAKKNGGKLPTYTWLNAKGYFYSYDVVRKAGKLKGFKRATA